MYGRMMKTAAVFASVLAFGCVAGDVDVSDEDDVEVLPKLATNSLTPAQLAGSSISFNPLNQATLDTYASTADGRATLPYVVGCALPAGVSVTAHYSNKGTAGTATFVGEIGLAPSWRTTALTVQEQRLVSGCVLARVNAAGTPVVVSLRGPSATLAVTSTEAAGYPREEGAFFGNIFQGAAFHIGACQGTAIAPANRRCAQPNGTLGGGLKTECGFSYAGLCSDVCTSGSYLSNCTGLNGELYDSVVTVYIK